MAIFQGRVNSINADGDDLCDFTCVVWQRGSKVDALMKTVLLPGQRGTCFVHDERKMFMKTEKTLFGILTITAAVPELDVRRLQANHNQYARMKHEWRRTNN
jgi:hypothetical protein